MDDDLLSVIRKETQKMYNGSNAMQNINKTLVTKFELIATIKVIEARLNTLEAQIKEKM